MLLHQPNKIQICWTYLMKLVLTCRTHYIIHFYRLLHTTWTNDLNLWYAFSSSFSVYFKVSLIPNANTYRLKTSAACSHLSCIWYCNQWVFLDQYINISNKGACLPGATRTPYGLFGIGFPEKNIFTECSPRKDATYSHRHTSGEVCLNFIGTVFLWPCGSRIITSGTPFPASTNKIKFK